MGTKMKSKTQAVKNKDNNKKAVGNGTNKEYNGVFVSCTFSSLGLHPTLCDQLRERMGFEGPTLVQAQAIPIVLSGRHALVNAATGTGKTIAYLAPIIHHLQSNEKRIERSDGTFALVLVPARELCLQVHEILQKLLHRFHWIVPGYIMGGESRSKEKARLRKGLTHWKQEREDGMGGIRQIICVGVSSIAEGRDGEAFGACSHRESQFWLGHVVSLTDTMQKHK
ncbi:unnamed protein product [Vicia faba]|uniref:ATP-dependent RNA helicase n=1 Tax=Vicia faba TaxID=3906 RepID=A0AAV1AAY1_VICFA|nr:unnamed protein product [Vicia faba]